MVDEGMALLCGECGWILAGIRRREAVAVPRCLACGYENLELHPVAPGVRMVRWPDRKAQERAVARPVVRPPLVHECLN